MLCFNHSITAAAALSFALLLGDIPNKASAEAPCQCTFTSVYPADCVVYGQLGDGNLIPWAVASQGCLDTFKIKDEAIGPKTLSNIFPNADGTGGSVSGFVNYMRFNDGSVASSIKAGFPQFYAESDVSPGKMDLLDEIMVDGTTTSCSSGGGESYCYNAMKSYFGTEPGASEMAGVGEQLYNVAAVSREKEQSLVRIRLCQDGATAECGALSDQVQETMASNSDKFCSAYGLGPAGYDYPKCGGGGGSDEDEDMFDPTTKETIDPMDGADDTSSSSKVVSGGAVLLVFAASLVKMAMGRDNGDYTTL